jgi:hypothetical protein
MANTALERSTPIKFTSIKIKSDRNPLAVEIKNTMIELEIFEHIDKPYVTGSLLFVDGDRVINSLDVSGAETVEITLEANTDVAVPVTKRFYIDKIVSSMKGNETNEVYTLHLIEDIAYISNLQNVNKSYTGKPSQILTSISKSFLGNKEVLTTDEDAQYMKVIVPNLTPLASMSWIKNRTSTSSGYPFYFFSPFSANSLYFTDLHTMLDRPAINEGAPYTYTESAMPTEVSTDKRRTILTYESKNTENLFELIDKGLVGANHNFVDITRNETKQVRFDMHKDVVEVLAKDNVLKSSPLFSADYNLNGESFNTIRSREITQLMSTNAYESHKSYGESLGEGTYRHNVIQQAMDGLLKKQPLTILVNGIDFLQRKGNSTIGNKLEIKFPANLNDEGKSPDRFDTKKSGNYLIYAAKHVFTIEDYRIAFTCVKLSNGEV